MKRWLMRRTTVSRPCAELVHNVGERVEENLKGRAEAHTHPDGSIAVHLSDDGFGPANSVLRVRFGVAVHRADGRTGFPLTWQADRARFAFPRFDGSLEFEPLSSDTTEVVLFGSYEPPLGMVGAAVDDAVLHRAAEATAAAILDHIIRILLAPEGEAPAASPPKAFTVRDVMTRDPFTMHPDLPVKTAALMLFHLRITGAPVVDDEGALLGVLTDRDLVDKEGHPRYGFGRYVEESWRRHDAVTVRDACTRPAQTTAPDVPLRDAVTQMQRLGIRRLVVVEGAHIVGVVTRSDVLKALIRTDADLQRAVEILLTDIAQPQVTANVEWGVVRLRGKVTHRSKVPRVATAVADVDGVVEVDSSLEWDVDDVTPVAVPLL